jgi:hypothetical protein
VQTKESSYAASDAEAEPLRSTDARITALLKARGLRFNPFQLTHSEGDAHLPAMQVRTPLLQLRGDAPNVIYGEAGSGKTARLLRNLCQATRQYPERRVLPVHVVLPACGDPRTDFAPALAQAIAAALLTTGLLHGPAYHPALAAQLAAVLDAYLDLPDWRALIAGAGDQEGLALMYDVANMPRSAQGIALPATWLRLADVHVEASPPTPADDASIARLIELAEVMGARSILILADNLGAPGRTPEEAGAWAARLWAWPARDGRVAVQLYAPLAAQPAIEATIGPQPSAVIRWDEQALRRLIERRLSATSDEVINHLQALGWTLQQENDVFAQSEGSPRRLIALIREELAWQAEARLPEPARKAAQASAIVNHNNAGVFQKVSDAPRQTPVTVALSQPFPKNMTGWLG